MGNVAPLELRPGIALFPLGLTLVTLGGAIALVSYYCHPEKRAVVPIALNTLAAALVGLVVKALTLGLWAFSYRAGLLWLLVLVLALVVWQLERLIRSPWGRVLKAIREDEEVAKALGKNVFAYKMQSFLLGGRSRRWPGRFMRGS